MPRWMLKSGTPRPVGDARTPSLISKDKTNASKPSPSDPKVGDKGAIKSGFNSKTRSKDADKSDSDLKTVNLTADPSTENISSRKQVNPAFSSFPVKQECEKTPAAELPTERPALEEIIVLGVALEGSKRTLPIEEGMASPSQADANDLASQICWLLMSTHELCLDHPLLYLFSNKMTIYFNVFDPFMKDRIGGDVYR